MNLANFFSEFSEFFSESERRERDQGWIRGIGVIIVNAKDLTGIKRVCIVSKLIKRSRKLAQKNRVKALRVKKLWTQKELAGKAGITEATLSFVENGLTEASDLTKQKIANAFGVEVEDLFPESSETGAGGRDQ